MITEQLKEKLKQIPESPGIYQMLDSKNSIIYIGKSKCLKKRVSSYFVQDPVWEKAKKMAPHIKDIEYIVTDTHLDAMLLECEMIKRIRPYFNVLMKQEQKYVYLVLEKNYKKNPLKTSYLKTEDSMILLRSRGRLESFITGMTHLYPFQKQKGKKYCFDYHIIPEKMTEEEFKENQIIIKDLCQNPTSMNKFILQLEKNMKQSAKEMNYELATKYRDLVEDSNYLLSYLQSYQNLLGKTIVYTVPLSKGYKLYYIKNGLVIDSKIITKNLELEKETEQFINELNKQKIDEDSIYSEKASIDYRAIVYTELTSADSNAIRFLS